MHDVPASCPARSGAWITAEISAAAVRHNLLLLRRAVGPKVRLLAVAKADAYGHGTKLLRDVLATNADGLAVATGPQALHLREMGYDGYLLGLLSPCPWGQEGPGGERLEELIERDVAMTVVCEAELRQVQIAAERRGRPARLHVKIDTGMTRSGVRPEGLATLLAAIDSAGPAVVLEGAYTHFSTADEEDKTFCMQQLNVFQAAVRPLLARSKPPVLHAANSAAALEFPAARLGMVRCGLAVYGYDPLGRVEGRPPLRPALRVHAPLIQIKDVPAGCEAGYGRTHRFERNSRIALVPVGYGDGYLRALSGRATMRVGGLDVPVCGRVSMDQVILDVTDVPGAKLGDPAEVVSPDPAAPHSIENLARLAGTIPYELVCRLGGPRVRRVRVSRFAEEPAPSVPAVREWIASAREPRSSPVEPSGR
jgi:alanine racemase